MLAVIDSGFAGVDVARNNLPVVMLLGAQSTHSTLASVPAEVSALKELFSEHQQQDDMLFQLEYEPFLTDSYLKTRLDRFRGQVALLHFAGHSDANGLLSNDAVVYARHLADIFSKWPNPPALIFLNGCQNAEQVKLFHAAGVGLVIATYRPIGDAKAAGFAKEFYLSLLASLSCDVETAFANAGSKVFLNDREAPRSLDIETLPQMDSGSWDWGLFPKFPGQGKWTLRQLVTNERPRYEANGELLNPYRGLESFRAQDRAYFFGREVLTAELCERIPAASLFMLLGASGSGKSSLVSAGVIPSLLDHAEWLIFTFRPGNAPFAELAASIAQHYYPDKQQAIERLKKKTELETALREQQIGLLDLLADIQKDSAQKELLLFIDQFEELFTQSQTTIIQSFQAQLIRLVDANLPRCHLLLVMRADFLSAALMSPRFAELLDQHPPKLLAAMGQAELRAAIEKPASKQQVVIEPALIEALLDAVENQPGSLPMLQYVLSLLWEQKKDHHILLEDYNRLGGLEKALETRANAIFDKFTTSEQEQGKNIFLRLIQPSENTEDTRRRAALSEFADTPEIQHIIQSLANERLITTKSEGKNSEGYIEVAHEALIRSWPRLKNWIDENRDSLRIQSRFAEAAKVWGREGRDSPQDYVYRGALLASAEEWAIGSKVTLSEVEKGFLEVSLEIRDRQQREEQQRKERELEQAKALLDEQKESARKQRRLFIVIGVFVLIVGVVTGFTLEYSKRAKEATLQLDEIAKKQEYERNRTDVEGDLTVFGTYYGGATAEKYFGYGVDKKHGIFTYFLARYLFQENVSVADAVSLAVNEVKVEQPKRRPELLVSLNGKVFLNPKSNIRKFHSLVFGWGHFDGEGMRNLGGAENDAHLIYEHLQELGYSPKLFLNLKADEFRVELENLYKELSQECLLSSGNSYGFKKVSLNFDDRCVNKNVAVFVYFSGFGMAKNGVTYIVPSDYSKNKKDNKLISIESIRAKLSKLAPIRIIVSDVAREDSGYNENIEHY